MICSDIPEVAFGVLAEVASCNYLLKSQWCFFSHSAKVDPV